MDYQIYFSRGGSRAHLIPRKNICQHFAKFRVISLCTVQKCADVGAVERIAGYQVPFMHRRGV